MRVRVGTFNLNNLFSRFNFSAEVDQIPHGDSGGLTLTFGPNAVQARTFMGKLFREKSPTDTAEVARRIREVMNSDVLAVQQVEHLEILRQFNATHLGSMYPHLALVEGNDPRLIDVAVMSKLPIGPIVSHQTAWHPSNPGKRVFGRDLLMVQIQDEKGEKLFNLYNTHLKSHYIPAGVDPVEGAAKANERRRLQAEVV